MHVTVNISLPKKLSAASCTDPDLCRKNCQTERELFNISQFPALVLLGLKGKKRM